jgi:hypothetical protein
MLVLFVGVSGRSLTILFAYGIMVEEFVRCDLFVSDVRRKISKKKLIDRKSVSD